jgi:hypothetical protein
VRPFIPTEFQDEWIFEGMEMTIKDAGDLTPAPMCTWKPPSKFKARRTWLPMAPSRTTPPAARSTRKIHAPGKESGWKMVWNWMYRWQNDGLTVGEVHWVWVRRGGDHSGHEIMNQGGKYAEYYEGGGSFERVLAGPYKRVMISYRADLADDGLQVLNKGEGFAKNTEFREYTGFTSPFDIAGTAFLILRYDDPRKADDSWAYIPSLRRVRRISVEVKSDSLLGTDHTLEDFYGFNGRPMEHDWEYIGSARLLVVARSRNDRHGLLRPQRLGCEGRLCAARSRRHAAVSEELDTHPYSTKFIYVDRQSGESFYANAFDKAGELWKSLAAPPRCGPRIPIMPPNQEKFGGTRRNA